MLREKHGPDFEVLPSDVPTRRLAEHLAGMANTKGGTVILLSKETGSAEERQEQLRKAREKALDAAMLCDPPLVLPLPQISQAGDQALLLIHVPPGLSKVHAVRGKFYGRSGDRNRVLSQRQVRRLLVERGDASFESQSPEGATLDDLDADKIARYWRTLEGMPAQSPEEALLLRGCLTEQNGQLAPTYAGILLFGRKPERFCRQSEIVAVRYLGEEMSDEFLREDIRDPLPEQIRRAEAFVVSHMRRGVRIHGLVREEEAEYPVKAIREAIVNAVAHRDYSIRGDSIRILMFGNRIEFYSPGRLPGHVTVQNIVSERFSRNEAIVQVLSDLGFIERLGYGIDRMISLMTGQGLPVPDFEETANGFKVTLYGHAGSFVATQPETSKWRLMNLTPRQEKALEYLAEQGRITNRDLQELAPDVSPETIRRDLADLVDKGLLLKIGEKRATYYILK